MRTVRTCLGLLCAAVLLAGGCRSDSSTTRASDKGMAAGVWPSRESNDLTRWTHQAYPTGQRQSSVIGIEKGVPFEARLNRSFQYDVIVTNLTSDRLDDVTVSEEIHDGLAIETSDPEGRMDDKTITWTLGTFDPGESKTIKVTSTADTLGALTSFASVTYERMLNSTFNIVEPKLVVSLTGPDEANVCEELEYRLEIANAGTGTIRNVTVSQPLPSGLTTLDGLEWLDYKIAQLGAGESKPFRVRLKAGHDGPFTLIVGAVADGDFSAASSGVMTTVHTPSLAISTSGPESRYLGTAAEYEIVVTNTGDGIAENTVVEETLPFGSRFVSATMGGRQLGDVVRWQLGELKPEESRTFTMKLDSKVIGPLNRSVHARADCVDAVYAESSTLYQGIPAIRLEVIDEKDPVRVGEETTYVITATNQGSAPGTNIRISCALEANTQFVEATGVTPGAHADNVVNFDSLATLAPQGKALWRIRVKATETGDVRFKVTMTSDQLTRPVEETEATNVYE